MRNFLKIISSYLSSVVGVAVSLVVLNFSFLIVLIVNTSKNVEINYRISQFSAGLVRQSSGYVLSSYGEQALQEQYEWAMLISDRGDLIWSKNIPDDFPRHYSITDIAGLTHWYFNDYPVSVWRRPDGLLVLGSEKHSQWIMTLEVPQRLLDDFIAWAPGLLVLNIVIATLLALIMGFRLFRAVKQIVRGIEDLSQQKPVNLPVRGLLADLANNLNRTAAKLQEQQIALRKRDDARTTWIAGISHDIRTPLSMVLGYASELEENPNLLAEERKQAGIIRQQSERITQLVSNLNLASKLEYDMQATQMAVVYPAVLLRECISAFYNTGGQEIDFAIDPQAEPATIFADAALVKRAINNLLENSINHNPQGTKVKVSASIISPDYCISVADQGTPIPDDVITSVCSTETPASLPAHGLGLILVRQIMRVHGGRIFFKSSSTFSNEVQLIFPLRPDG